MAKIFHQNIRCCETNSDSQTLEVLKHLDELLSQASPIPYQKGNVVFYEGHFAMGFYFLKQGEVLLSKGKSLENQEGPIFNRGLLGLFHLLSNTPHCATAIAKTNLEILFIPKSAVLGLLSSSFKKLKERRKKNNGR